MSKFISLCLLGTILAQPVQAALVYQGEYNPNQSMQEYFNASYYNYSKPIIFVFFNNDPCYDCGETANLIQQIYEQNYQGKYSFFIINYQNDQEYNFTSNYNLSRPLEVVLQNVEDGQALGFEKLNDLPNMTSAPVSFADYLTYRINSFFGD